LFGNGATGKLGSPRRGARTLAPGPVARKAKAHGRGERNIFGVNIYSLLADINRDMVTVGDLDYEYLAQSLQL